MVYKMGVFFTLLLSVGLAGSARAGGPATPQQTIAEVETIVSQADEVSKELYQKGLAATRNSDWDQAEVFFQSVLDRHPDFLEADLRIAAIWLLTQRVGEARVKLEGLRKKHPDNTAIRDLLVWTYDLPAL